MTIHSDVSLAFEDVCFEVAIMRAHRWGWSCRWTSTQLGRTS